MPSDQAVWIIAGCGAGLVLVVLAFLIARHFALSSHVEQHSVLLANQREINSKYKTSFFKYSDQFWWTVNCGSLQEFKRKNTYTSIRSFVDGRVSREHNQWAELLRKLDSNRHLWEKYAAESDSNMDANSGKGYKTFRKIWLVSKAGYTRIEDNYWKQCLLTPKTDIGITVHVTYTSPKGRNHYDQDWPFDSSAIEESLGRITKRNEYERSAAYQRSLVTPGKRFDIMRRDHFTCQLCHRTRADGAKLEVDHKMPVARGGKSTDDNLWTLCHECNSGKRAKLLPGIA